MPHDHEDHDFNSIKVQLKLPEASPLILAPIFQFHKGTIKTLGNVPPPRFLVGHFNSIKVQLKR